MYNEHLNYKWPISRDFKKKKDNIKIILPEIALKMDILLKDLLAFLKYIF